MTGFPGAAVRTNQRPTPAIGAAEFIRDLDLNKYLFWADTRWTDFSGASVETAPFPQAPPALTAAQVGQPVTCPSGTWAGYPAPDLTYQWKRGPSNIQGATSATYTPVLGDSTAPLSCAVTATNSAGSRSVTTNGIGVAQPADLVNIATLPIKAGAVGGAVAATIDKILGADVRLLEGDALFAISPDKSSIVAGSIKLAQGDYTVTVIATSPDKRTTTQHQVTITVGPPSDTPGPSNSSPPAISGTAQVGQTLAASRGNWSNSPTSYSYAFAAGGAVVQTGSSNTYVPKAADVGKTIRVTVTASNAGGSASATSAATGAVIAESTGTTPPDGTSPPSGFTLLVGSDGQQLIGSDSQELYGVAA